MADEKLKVAGIKLKIDGAATFSDNLNKINSRLKTNSAELKKVRAQYQDNEKSIEGLTAKQKALQSSLDAQKKKTSELKDVLNEAAEEYGENSKEVERLKSAVAQSEAAEAGFEAQLRETNDLIADQSNKLKNLGKKLDEGGSKIEKFGEKTSKVGGKLTTGLTLPIAALGTAAGKMWLDFDKAAAKVETIMDKNVMSADEMKQGILDSANEIGYAAEEYANAVYEALSAGVKTEDAISFVKDAAKLSEAGYTSLTKAVDIQTTAMNAYNMSADEAAHISDILILTQNKGKTTVDALADSMGKVIPTAKNVNVELDQVGVAYSVMTAKGIKTENATTYLNSMLNELSKSSSKASKVLKKETGSSFSELMEKGYSVADALQIISDAASKNGKSLNEMFGSAEASKAALSLVSQEGMTFNDVLKEFNESSGITDSSFETMQTDGVKLTKEIARLKNEAMELGKELTPIVTAATDGLKGITTWFGKLSDSEKKTAVKTLAFVAAMGPVVSIGGKIIKTGGTVVKTVGKMADFFSKSGKSATIMATGTQAVAVGTNAAAAGTKALSSAISCSNPWLLAAVAIIGALTYAYTSAKKEQEEFAESASRIPEAMSNYQDMVSSATSVLSGFNAENKLSNEELSKIDKSIEKAQKNIIAIAENAAAESRAITDSERAEIQELIGMIDSYTSKKLEAYQEQQGIVRAMVENETNMTTEAAAQYQASAEQAYNDMINKAQEIRLKAYADANGNKDLEKAADDAFNTAKNDALKTYGETLSGITEKYYAQNVAVDEGAQKIIEYREKIQELEDELDEIEARPDTDFYKITDMEDTLAEIDEAKEGLKNAISDLDEDSVAIVGAWMSMAAETEIYGGQISKEASEMVSGICDSIENLPKDVKKTFTDAMDGALKGLKEKESTLYAKATSIANGVIARMNKALDIRSPSRVTRRMFRYVDEGAIYGLKDKEQELYSQGEKLGIGTAAAISRGYSSKAVNIGTLADLYPTVNRAGAAYSSSRTYNSTYSNDTYDSGIHIGTLNVNGASGAGNLMSELETIEYARREQARSRGGK